MSGKRDEEATTVLRGKIDGVTAGPESRGTSAPHTNGGNGTGGAPRKGGAALSRKELAKRLSSLEMQLDSTEVDIKVDRDKAIAVPIDQLPALGVAFASLPEAIRTMIGTASLPNNLFTITDALGNPIDAANLMRFNDGTGLLASFRDAVNGFGQARLHEVAGGGVMPYDPTMLFMAAAIMQINHKLDAIQNTQRKMFDYLRQKDKAELRGDTETLAGILNGYQFNWNNDMWRNNNHMKVLDIKQEMAKASIHLRAQITGLLQEGQFIENRDAVGKRSDGVADLMKEYRLTVYNHAFASFLEPMLSENFDAEYLKKTAEDIEDRRLKYLRFYTDIYNKIEDRSNHTPEAAVLDGVSFLGRKLGEAVATVPLIGDKTPIDEALIGAGDNVERFNADRTDDLLKSMRGARLPHTKEFREGVEMLNRLHNTPMALACDKDNVYLLPQ